MPKNLHELRDPIHVFVRLSSEERKVLNSRPFQRLRHIHQLALTYLVYPGATHRRFEHSLGVMELASRIFDVVTHRDAVMGQIRDLLPELADEEGLRYWRRVLRMAALCHDIGHLPFSHAAEDELLPSGWDHERITLDLILGSEMGVIWGFMTPPLRALDVAKLAVGPKKLKGERFSTWETILAEVIVGDAFGADRIDYLLRDSHHTGVGYGKFDHHRLIDTLRLLPSPPQGEEEYPRPALGIQEGGLQSAEALLLARYFMYSQLYLHRVRRIYDIHLKDFLREWLPEGRFPTLADELLRMTDNEVTAAMLAAADTPGTAGHDPARRIARREHFRVLYQRNSADTVVSPDAARLIAEAAREQFGDEKIRYDRYPPKGSAPDFPVLMLDERVASSISVSPALAHLPLASAEYVFIDPACLSDARKWLEMKRDTIIREEEEVEE